ncbi:MAG: 50S ribosomal protein L21 [Clostridia bacterium]|nr:50S ribosomal protein L21 [Clostridia bacterium]
MYAIISAGNKQYRVSVGDTIYIDKVNQEDGSAISFDALMVENNGEIKVGTPTVAGAKVEGKVVAQVKGEKIMIYKYKSKKNYHRRQGHRQPYTKVEITAINA